MNAAVRQLPHHIIKHVSGLCMSFHSMFPVCVCLSTKCFRFVYVHSQLVSGLCMSIYNMFPICVCPTTINILVQLHLSLITPFPLPTLSNVINVHILKSISYMSAKLQLRSTNHIRLKPDRKLLNQCDSTHVTPLFIVAVYGSSYMLFIYSFVCLDAKNSVRKSRGIMNRRLKNNLRPG